MLSSIERYCLTYCLTFTGIEPKTLRLKAIPKLNLPHIALHSTRVQPKPKKI